MSGAPAAKAIGRSLRTYRAPGRAALLDAFHRRFLGAGDLAFDIGAHVGDRTASFRRLGARVVCVEPQPRLARLLRLLFRRDPEVIRIAALVGAAPDGETLLRLNSANPTVATASARFMEAAAGAAGWEGQHWDGAVACPVTSLDALAVAHGRPHFVKLDVEGFEAEALAGLSVPPRALSFEFTTIQRDVAADCLRRLAALGYRAFNACLGEDMAFARSTPCGADALAAWIADLPEAANSGDAYASLEPGRITP